jgi:hypothetical protein
MNTAPGVVDWLAQFSQSLTNLTLQNGGALSNFGMILLTGGYLLDSGNPKL